MIHPRYFEPKRRARFVGLLRFAFLAAGVLAAGVTTAAEEGPETNVIEFEMHLRGNKGLVRCGLFDEKGWLKTPVRSDTAKPDARSAVCVFERVPEGTYGISAFHDENNNGKLDTNLVGYPLEDYCASNNERNTFSAPDFDGAKFAYRGGQRRLAAYMK